MCFIFWKKYTLCRRRKRRRKEANVRTSINLEWRKESLPYCQVVHTRLMVFTLRNSAKWQLPLFKSLSLSLICISEITKCSSETQIHCYGAKRTQIAYCSVLGDPAVSSVWNYELLWVPLPLRLPASRPWRSQRVHCCSVAVVVAREGDHGLCDI